MRHLQAKWIVPLLLLLAIYVAEQIRIGRPEHKYRLSVEVETPTGLASASGVLSVRPNRSYDGTASGSSSPQTKGDALLVDLGGGRSVVLLLAVGSDGSKFEEPSFLPTRLFGASGRRTGFRDVKNFAGMAPVSVPDELRPTIVAFIDTRDPRSARRVSGDDLEPFFGKGYRLKNVLLAIVANGFWPLDIGGALGEPVTRGIADKLRWLPDGAATALQAAGLKTGEGFLPEMAFTRR